MTDVSTTCAEAIFRAKLTRKPSSNHFLNENLPAENKILQKISITQLNMFSLKEIFAIDLEIKDDFFGGNDCVKGMLQIKS